LSFNSHLAVPSFNSHSFGNWLLGHSLSFNWEVERGGLRNNNYKQYKTGFVSLIFDNISKGYLRREMSDR